MSPFIGRVHVCLLLVLSSQISASEHFSESLYFGLIKRHEHHDSAPPDPTVPIDTILYLHIVLQLLTWAILFPIGMVLGLTRSRWHVPLQSFATLLSLVGFQLGHIHGGRQFYHTAHATFATFCFYYMLTQVGLGIFCKLHIMEQSLRPSVAKVHSIFGKIFPVISWTQVVFGFITVQGFCFQTPNQNLAQCITHHVTGSMFQAYAIVALLFVRYKLNSANERNREYSEAWIICWIGILNTGLGSIGQTNQLLIALGVFWWIGGLLGIWLGHDEKPSIVPATIVLITGVAMALTEQASTLATRVYTFLGFVLSGAAAMRLWEIQTASVKEEQEQISAFQNICPLFLMLGGITFQSSTSEQLSWIETTQMGSSAYILLIAAASYAFYLFINLLVSLYENSGHNAKEESLPMMSWSFWRETFRTKQDSPYESLDPNNPSRLTTDETDSLELTDRYWQEVEPSTSTSRA